MSSRLYLPLTAFFMSNLLVGCFEEADQGSIEEMDDKIEGQLFDIGRMEEFIAAEEAKLAEFQQAAQDVEETKELTATLEETMKMIEDGVTRNSDIADAINLADLEFSQYRNVYRKYARKSALGKVVDLSATLGDAYQSVKILSVNPLGIKVYMSSGPKEIPLRDLTPDVREMLQMSEDEAMASREAKNVLIAERATKFEKWKAGQADRSDESRKAAIVSKMKEIREAIYQREGEINIRLQKMKGWKSKASNLELHASRERNKGKSNKLRRLSELARDKATALSDDNSDSWIVVGRLRAELEDLKRMGIH